MPTKLRDRLRPSQVLFCVLVLSLAAPASAGGRCTAGLLFHPLRLGNSVLENKPRQLGTWEQCSKECAEEADCKCFSFNEKTDHCWLMKMCTSPGMGAKTTVSGPAGCNILDTSEAEYNCKPDVDVPGEILGEPRSKVHNILRCRQLCTGTPECAAYVYTKDKTCTMKSRMRTPVAVDASVGATLCEKRKRKVDPSKNKPSAADQRGAKVKDTLDPAEKYIMPCESNVKLEGTTARTVTSVASIAGCLQHCREDPTCLGLSYTERSQECGLMTQLEKTTPGLGTSSCKKISADVQVEENEEVTGGVSAKYSFGCRRGLKIPGMDYKAFSPVDTAEDCADLCEYPTCVAFVYSPPAQCELKYSLSPPKEADLDVEMCIRRTVPFTGVQIRSRAAMKLKPREVIQNPIAHESTPAPTPVPTTATPAPTPVPTTPTPVPTTTAPVSTPVPTTSAPVTTPVPTTSAPVTTPPKATPVTDPACKEGFTLASHDLVVEDIASLEACKALCDGNAKCAAVSYRRSECSLAFAAATLKPDAETVSCTVRQVESVDQPTRPTGGGRGGRGRGRGEVTSPPDTPTPTDPPTAPPVTDPPTTAPVTDPPVVPPVGGRGRGGGSRGRGGGRGTPAPGPELEVPGFECVQGKKLLGGVLVEVPGVESLAGCQGYCTRNDKCTGVTFADGRCVLMSYVLDEMDLAGAVSCRGGGTASSIEVPGYICERGVDYDAAPIATFEDTVLPSECATLCKKVPACMAFSVDSRSRQCTLKPAAAGAVKRAPVVSCQRESKESAMFECEHGMSGGGGVLASVPSSSMPSCRALCAKASECRAVAMDGTDCTLLSSVEEKVGSSEVCRKVEADFRCIAGLATDASPTKSETTSLAGCVAMCTAPCKMAVHERGTCRLYNAEVTITDSPGGVVCIPVGSVVAGFDFSEAKRVQEIGDQAPVAFEDSGFDCTSGSGSTAEDLAIVEAPSLTDCLEQCLSIPNCVQVVYHGARTCAIKQGVGETTRARSSQVCTRDRGEELTECITAGFEGGQLSPPTPQPRDLAGCRKACGKVAECRVAVFHRGVCSLHGAEAVQTAGTATGCHRPDDFVCKKGMTVDTETLLTLEAVATLKACQGHCLTIPSCGHIELVGESCSIKATGGVPSTAGEGVLCTRPRILKPTPLHVTAPELPALEGEYLVGSGQKRGFPWFERRGGGVSIAVGGKGRWVLTAGEVEVKSAQPAKGVLPQDVAEWVIDGRGKVSLGVRARVEEAVGFKCTEGSELGGVDLMVIEQMAGAGECQRLCSQIPLCRAVVLQRGGVCHLLGEVGEARVVEESVSCTRTKEEVATVVSPQGYHCTERSGWTGDELLTLEKVVSLSACTASCSRVGLCKAVVYRDDRCSIFGKGSVQPGESVACERTAMPEEEANTKSQSGPTCAPLNHGWEGGDLMSLEGVESADECLAACARIPSCERVVFQGTVCHLKSHEARPGMLVEGSTACSSECPPGKLGEVLLLIESVPTLSECRTHCKAIPGCAGVVYSGACALKERGEVLEGCAVEPEGESLGVYVPHSPGLSGNYPRTGTHNSAPLFGRETRLYRGEDGEWVLTHDPEGHVKGLGVVRTVGRPAHPSEAKRWLFFDGTEARGVVVGREDEVKAMGLHDVHPVGYSCRQGVGYSSPLLYLEDIASLAECQEQCTKFPTCSKVSFASPLCYIYDGQATEVKQPGAMGCVREEAEEGEKAGDITCVTGAYDGELLFVLEGVELEGCKKQCTAFPGCKAVEFQSAGCALKGPGAMHSRTEGVVCLKQASKAATDTEPSTSTEDFVCEEGKTVEGDSLEEVAVPSPEKCEAKCTATPQCTSFVFLGDSCVLKASQIFAPSTTAGIVACSRQQHRIIYKDVSKPLVPSVAVHIPELPAASGMYFPSELSTQNATIFTSNYRRLFVGWDNKWYISLGVTGPKRGVGAVRSMEPAMGRGPHEMSQWEYKDKRWMVSTGVVGKPEALRGVGIDTDSLIMGMDKHAPVKFRCTSAMTYEGEDLMDVGEVKSALGCKRLCVARGCEALVFSPVEKRCRLKGAGSQAKPATDGVYLACEKVPPPKPRPEAAATPAPTTKEVGLSHYVCDAQGYDGGDLFMLDSVGSLAQCQQQCDRLKECEVVVMDDRKTCMLKSASAVAVSAEDTTGCVRKATAKKGKEEKEDKEECRCLYEWTSVDAGGACNVTQYGCPAVACDDDSQPVWCQVANPGCRTEEPGGWSWCTPPKERDDSGNTTRVARRRKAFALHHLDLEGLQRGDHANGCYKAHVTVEAVIDYTSGLTSEVFHTHDAMADVGSLSRPLLVTTTYQIVLESVPKGIGSLIKNLLALELGDPNSIFRTLMNPVFKRHGMPEIPENRRVGFITPTPPVVRIENICECETTPAPDEAAPADEDETPAPTPVPTAPCGDFEEAWLIAFSQTFGANRTLMNVTHTGPFWGAPPPAQFTLSPMTLTPGTDAPDTPSPPVAPLRAGETAVPETNAPPTPVPVVFVTFTIMLPLTLQQFLDKEDEFINSMANSLGIPAKWIHIEIVDRSGPGGSAKVKGNLQRFHSLALEKEKKVGVRISVVPDGTEQYDKQSLHVSASRKAAMSATFSAFDVSRSHHFKCVSGTSLIGGDLLRIEGSLSAEECLKQCERVPECIKMSYNSATRVCSLRTQHAASVAGSKAVSCTKTAPARTAGTTYTCSKDKVYLGGDLFITKGHDGIEDCRELCDSVHGECDLYVFDARDGTCFLKTAEGAVGIEVEGGADSTACLADTSEGDETPEPIASGTEKGGALDLETFVTDFTACISDRSKCPFSEEVLGLFPRIWRQYSNGEGQSLCDIAKTDAVGKADSGKEYDCHAGHTIGGDLVEVHGIDGPVDCYKECSRVPRCEVAEVDIPSKTCYLRSQHTANAPGGRSGSIVCHRERTRRRGLRTLSQPAPHSERVKETTETAIVALTLSGATSETLDTPHTHYRVAQSIQDVLLESGWSIPASHVRVTAFESFTNGAWTGRKGEKVGGVDVPVANGDTRITLAVPVESEAIRGVLKRDVLSEKLRHRLAGSAAGLRVLGVGVASKEEPSLPPRCRNVRYVGSELFTLDGVKTVDECQRHCQGIPGCAVSLHRDTSCTLRGAGAAVAGEDTSVVACLREGWEGSGVECVEGTLAVLGSEIFSVPIPDLDQCITACRQVPSCLHVTYNTTACTLLGASSSTDFVSSPTTMTCTRRGATPATKEGKHTCLEGAAFPAATPLFPPIASPSTAQCTALCSMVPSCVMAQHTNGECRLLGEGGDKVLSPASKTCFKETKRHRTYQCEKAKGMVGGELLSLDVGAEECQRRCDAIEACRAVTIDGDDGCQLRAKGEMIMAEGAVTCTADDQAPSPSLSPTSLTECQERSRPYAPTLFTVVDVTLEQCKVSCGEIPGCAMIQHREGECVLLPSEATEGHTGLPTFRTCAAPRPDTPHCTQTSLLQGPSLRTFPAKEHLACLPPCAQDPQCRGYVHADGACYLKGGEATMMRANTSGATACLVGANAANIALPEGVPCQYRSRVAGGYLMTIPNVLTPLECIERCRGVAGECRRILFRPGHCALYRPKGKVEYAEGAEGVVCDVAQAPPPLPSPYHCEEGWDMSGVSIRETSALSAAECMATCTRTPECHVAVFREGSCSLKRGDGVRLVVRGTTLCRDEGEEGEEGDRWECDPKPSVTLVGNTLVELDKAMSAEDCMSLCEVVPGCRYSVYTAHGGCHLKGKGAVAIATDLLEAIALRTSTVPPPAGHTCSRGRKAPDDTWSCRAGGTATATPPLLTITAPKDSCLAACSITPRCLAVALRGERCDLLEVSPGWEPETSSGSVCTRVVQEEVDKEGWECTGHAGHAGSVIEEFRGGAEGLRECQEALSTHRKISFNSATGRCVAYGDTAVTVTTPSPSSAACSLVRLPLPRLGGTPCVCKSSWNAVHFGHKCGDMQSGCPAAACDGHAFRWCVVDDPTCSTAQPGGWAYCDSVGAQNVPDEVRGKLHAAARDSDRLRGMVATLRAPEGNQEALAHQYYVVLLLTGLVLAIVGWRAYRLVVERQAVGAKPGVKKDGPPTVSGVRLRKPLREPSGMIFKGNMLVRVEESSPAFNAGLSRFVGRRVVSINGCLVDSSGYSSQGAVASVLTHSSGAELEFEDEEPVKTVTLTLSHGVSRLNPEVFAAEFASQMQLDPSQVTVSHVCPDQEGKARVTISVRDIGGVTRGVLLSDLVKQRCSDRREELRRLCILGVLGDTEGTALDRIPSILVVKTADPRLPQSLAGEFMYTEGTMNGRPVWQRNNRFYMHKTKSGNWAVSTDMADGILVEGVPLSAADPPHAGMKWLLQDGDRAVSFSVSVPSSPGSSSDDDFYKVIDPSSPLKTEV